MTRKHTGHTGLWLGAAGLAVVSVLGAARPAQACGGFFCSQTRVDQSGEQIVFSISPDHVTAYIQISFTGKAKDFAWVVPVQSKPVISVGSQAVFTQLQGRTTPVFNVDWGTSIAGQCQGRSVDLAGAAAPTAGAKDATGVQVVDEREVGPYKTVTLESKDADELIKWLNDNGYEQPASSTPLIKHYVDKNMLFVALRLKQNATVGEIQPLVLDMDSDPEACVPLILTQVAATPDMPVRVYVLSDYRAFPRNWFHVEINERRINWLAGGSNYGALVTQAIDEAAGHAFVTEYAGPSSIMKGTLYTPGRWNLEALRGITDPARLVSTIAQMGYPRDQTMLALFRTYIPEPQLLVDKGVSETAFYNGIANYKTELAGFQVNIDAFIAALDAAVVQPAKGAQAMFDGKPYLTRLYSTVSPDEMTRDPLFHMNPDLPPVSNVHTARGTGTCSADGQLQNIMLTLPGGDRILLDQPWRPYSSNTMWTYAASESAARTIELVGTSGKPIRYTRAQAKVADVYLDKESPELVRGRVPAGLISMPASTSGGCRVTGRADSADPLVLLLLSALVGAVIRERRRR